MNKYIRGIVGGSLGICKIWLCKLFGGRDIKFPFVMITSPFSELTVERDSKVFVGEKFRMRGGSKLRVRKNATCRIGNNISLNHGVFIVCHNRIEIGDNVQFGPNVLMYDHDHDYKIEGGINEGKFKTGEIIIGNNVWIGAGSIILRNTKIGDNSVVAAGSVIRGEFPENTLIYQHRETEVKKFRN